MLGRMCHTAMLLQFTTHKWLSLIVSLLREHIPPAQNWQLPTPQRVCLCFFSFFKEVDRRWKNSDSCWSTIKKNNKTLLGVSFRTAFEDPQQKLVNNPLWFFFNPTNYWDFRTSVCLVNCKRGIIYWHTWMLCLRLTINWYVFSFQHMVCLHKELLSILLLLMCM